jgi:hypothetical protein
VLPQLINIARRSYFAILEAGRLGEGVAMSALISVVVGLAFMLVVLVLATLEEGWRFLAFFACTAVTGMAAASLGSGVMVIGLVLVTAAWAAWDASRLNFTAYRGGNAPIVLFLGILSFWVIALPWYLARRGRIRKGLVPLRQGTPAGGQTA